MADTKYKLRYLPLFYDDINKTDYKQQLLKLLSLEYNCSPDVFDSGDNILTESKLCDGRRMYSNKKYFFHMVTLGSNAVITADPCLHPFFKEYIKGKRCSGMDADWY